MKGPWCSQVQASRTVRWKFAGVWLGAGEGWREVTGRNLHEEAESAKGVGGGCQTQKESSEKRIKVPFPLEQEALF